MQTGGRLNMLMEERFSRILALVDQEGSVKIADLVQRLDISESTVRRDLAAMDEKGMLVKVHGGAISLNRPQVTVRDESIGKRKAQFTEEKRRIAKYAASLIQPNDLVFLDAGTTTELLLDYLSLRDASFVTHAVNHALRLSAMGFKVYLLGGEMKSITEIVFGEQTVGALSKFRFSKGFFGTNGISLAGGYTTPDPREAAVKAAALAACRQRYILADESKFNTESYVRFARFKEATVITNRKPEGDLNEQENILIV